MKPLWQRSIIYLILVVLSVAVGIWAILYFDLAGHVLISLDSNGTASSSESTAVGAPPTGQQPGVPSPPGQAASPPKSEQNPPLAQAKVERGQLIARFKGRVISDEQFQLTQTIDGLELISQGKFYLRLLIVNATINYSQQIQWGGDFRPQRYSLVARGPLGLGDRSIQIEIGLQQATIINGNSKKRRPLPSGPFFLAGSFSSYLVLPKILSAHAQAVRLELPVLPSGWREDTAPGQGATERADIASSLTLERTGAATLIGNGPEAKQLQVERYSLKMGGLVSDFFIKGDQFIGSLSRPAGPDQLSVYRADLFPQGFHLK